MLDYVEDLYRDVALPPMADHRLEAFLPASRRSAVAAPWPLRITLSGRPWAPGPGYKLAYAPGGIPIVPIPLWRNPFHDACRSPRPGTYSRKATSPA